MLEINLAQAGRADAAENTQRIANHRPAQLQCFVVAWWKRVPREPGDDPRQSIAFECLEVIRQETDFLEFAPHHADGSASFREPQKSKLGYRHIGPNPPRH